MTLPNPNSYSDTDMKVFNKVASELVYNYFTCSFGKKPTNKDDENFERIQAEYIFDDKFLKDTFKEKKFERCRNILVIGAGATNDSFKAIPQGVGTMENIESSFGLKLLTNKSTRRRYNQEISNFQMQGGRNSNNDRRDANNEFDFEGFLSFIARIVPEEELRNEIQKNFNHRWCPTLFYEIVAHLFKHSFIDVIINFNFDELLDQALEEELGKEYFRSIILDGECPNIDDIVIDGRLKVPIYIKPHGTAKHKSLLRFTKDQYLHLPEKIKHLIAELVSGSIGDGKEKIDRVNLICAGFNMKSIEFNEILEKNLSEKSAIYHFTWDKLPKSGNRKIDSKITANHAIFLKEKRVNNTINTPLGEAFRNLWKTIKAQLKSVRREVPSDDSLLFKDDVPKYIEPRGIARHEIISYLFYNRAKAYHDNIDDAKKYLSYFATMDYFKDRIIIELAIALARNNGVVEIQELLNERLGFFYEEYKKRMEYSENNKADNPNNPKTFIEFCNIFKLTNTYSFSKNLLNLPEPFFYSETSLEEDIDAIEKAANTQFQNFTKIFSDSWEANKKKNGNQKISIVVFNIILCLIRTQKLSQTFIDNFKSLENLKISDRSGDFPMFENLLKLFQKINSSSYYDIFPNYYDKKHLIFESITKNKILNTDLSVKYNYNSLVTDSEKWDILLIISDRGNPLKLLDRKNNLTDFGQRRKKVILICCYHSMKIKYFEEMIKIKEQKEQELNEQNSDLEISQYDIFKTFLTEYTDKLNRKYREEGLNIVVEIYALPYWHHNHHMALFLKKSNIDNNEIFPFDDNLKIKNKNWNLNGCIYFYKKGFTNNINPIFIGKLQSDHIQKNHSLYKYYIQNIKKDSEKILSIFFSYKSAADNYMRKEMKEMDVIDDTEKIIKNEFDSLNAFWASNN